MEHDIGRQSFFSPPVMDPSQVSMVSPAPIETTLIPTTDEIAEECPRFRILIVGRSGVGKSSLINAIFKASLADVEAGTANIDEGITSPHNKHLMIHDSEGYEPGDEEKFRVLERFITERSQKETIAERLHAIWLCITSPYAGGPIFQAWDEKIFRLNQRKVPIIVVYTKFDLFMANNQRRKGNTGRSDGSLEFAEKYFYEKYAQQFSKSTKNIEGHIPYTIVSKSLPATLLPLVEMTRKNIRAESTSISSGLSPESVEDFLDATQITFATAQRVDTSGKIDASIKVGKKKYWRAIASGIHFLNFSLKKCLDVIHKDLVAVWNIRDMEGFFLDDAFRGKMLIFVGELGNRDQSDNALQGRPVMAPGDLANLWASGVYKRWPEHVRCLMGYVVDLTLILQGVFLVSLQDHSEGKVTLDRVHEVIYEFYFSEKKRRIHNAIRAFQPSFAKSDVVDKIESLLKENEIEKSDTQFDLSRPPLPSLLKILRFELSAKSITVNQVVLGLARKVFNSLNDPQDYVRAVSEIRDQSAVEMLIDFSLILLQTNSLSKIVQDGNRKARTLMFTLVTETNVVPRSLFITNVKIDNEGAINIGGFGRVFKGEYDKKVVALKLMDKRRKNSEFSQGFVLEVLARRSLSHDFVLPLYGIFIDRSQPFFVSPFIATSLTQWRRTQSPSVADVNNLVLEVAEGVRYIHTVGIVHGDLRGENVLLDAENHCQIAADVGLSQQSSAVVTLSSEAFLFNFAAPELFVNLENQEAQVGTKTTQTDVYAFGCLYYAIFFDTIPFVENNEYQIMQLVKAGKRPDRLPNPMMRECIWDLIQSCWNTNPFERPTMERVVVQLKTFTPLLSFLATLKSSPLGSTMVNYDTLRLMYELFEPCEADTTVSELETSDIELILDSLLQLLLDGSLTTLGIRDAPRKARRLMFKLASKTHIVPKSLFITGVTTETHAIVAGGFARVFKGEHKGMKVAVKMVERGRNDTSLVRDFCQEALTWRSFSHRSILPLLGIYKNDSRLCLVSPFMPNGTLMQWREKCTPTAIKVHKLMLEVAEGVQHLHTEGIVHGDLHGDNVLLDSDFHCKITDFGLTRPSGTVVSAPTRTFCLKFAAPELFGMCTKCGHSVCSEDHDTPQRNKTMKTDVYAFGCIYYATFFGTVPFHDKTEFEIVRLFMDGKRPHRLESPKMADETWNLIQHCWKSKPSERSTMDAVVMAMSSP